MKGWIVLTMFGAALVGIVALGGPAARAEAPPDLQEGDLLVGAASGPAWLGATGGVVFRVREEDGAVPFCASPVNGLDPMYWNVPEEVAVDSRGRVVFLAYMGGGAAMQDWGLFRCDRLGATPELLAVLPSDDTYDPGPLPFADARFEGVRGLHVRRVRGFQVEGDTIRTIEEDSYVFAAALWDAETRTRTRIKTLVYRTVTDIWEEGPPPAVDPVGLGTLPDMVVSGDSTYSVHERVLRRTRDPLTLEASGTVRGEKFKVRIGLFGGFKEIGGTVGTAAFALDDLTVPNVPVCSPDGSGISTLVPYGLTGDARTGAVFEPAALREVVVAGDLGIVVATQGASPYLANVDTRLLDFDPGNDRSALFLRPELGCVPQRGVGFTPILPWSDPSPPAGQPAYNGSDRLVANRVGVFGTQRRNGRVFRVTPGDRVQTLASGLVGPMGIAAYPADVGAAFGGAIVIRIDSPVDVLVTAPDGRRIGVVDGASVNELGLDGFVGDPGEPRFYAIRNPQPGTYAVESTGTGAGPYAIHVYSADLSQPGVGQHVVTRGLATLGGAGTHDFTLAADGVVAFVAQAPGDLVAPVTAASVSPQPNGAGWNRTDVTATLSASDEGGSGVREIVVRVDGVETVIPGSTAQVPVTSEGTTTIAYFARDAAGNAGEEQLLTVRIDRTPPTIAGQRAPEANANGWTNRDVSVTFSCGDALSGVASCPGSILVAEEGRDMVVSGEAVDVAGNRAPATISGISIDKTAPEIAAARTPAPNVYGWNDGDVTVVFTCSDARSGIESCSPSPQVVTGEGAGQSRTAEAVDRAGNRATATVGEINIDRTPPAVSCSASPAVLWPPNHRLVDVTASVQVRDELSGPAGFLLLSVTSNQPDDGSGDGATTGDVAGWTPGTPDVAGQLRAERAPRGSGRVYSLVYEGRDLAGNAARCDATVVVPRNGAGG